jgi:hypothetical protein
MDSVNVVRRTEVETAALEGQRFVVIRQIFVIPATNTPQHAAG